MINYHYNSVYSHTYTLKGKWSWLQIHGCRHGQLCTLHKQKSQFDSVFSVARSVLCSRCPWKCPTPESSCLPEKFSMFHIYYGYSNRKRLSILSLSKTIPWICFGPFPLQHSPVSGYHLHLWWNVLAVLWQNLKNMCHHVRCYCYSVCPHCNHLEIFEFWCVIQVHRKLKGRGILIWLSLHLVAGKR